MIDFSNKTALVTGAGGAIGRAAAQLFNRLGAELVLTDLDVKAVQETLNDLPRGAVAAVAAKQDAALTEDAEQAVALALKTFGKLDIVVTIAGALRKSAFVDTDDSAMATAMATNFHGVFATCRTAASALRPGGAIVTVASLAGHTGRAGASAYAAAKGAVLALTKSLAQELGPQARVNAVSPGFVASALSSIVVADQTDLIDRIPLRRLGSPADVAQAIAFLSSDAASYISGQVLHVNGGLYAPG